MGRTSGFGGCGGRFVLALGTVSGSDTGGDSDQCLNVSLTVIDYDGGVRHRRSCCRNNRETAHRGRWCTAGQNDRCTSGRDDRSTAGRDDRRTAGRSGNHRRRVDRRGLILLLCGRASCSSGRESDVSVLHRESKTLVVLRVAMVDKLML